MANASELSSYASSVLDRLTPSEQGISLASPLIASVVTFAAATLPIYVGLFLPSLSRRWEGGRRAFLYGVGIGILFASFFDLAKETAGISTSTLRSPLDFLNILSLAVGLLAFLALYRTKWMGQASSLLLLYLWALLGVGLHGVGEGIVIGYDFSTGATVLSIAQVGSFVLHKVGEGITIGIILMERGHLGRHAGLSGLVAGSPTFLGALAGVLGLSSYASTLFFAVSAGATIFMATKFASLAGGSSSRTIVGIFVAFLYMYISGVLHQFE